MWHSYESLQSYIIFLNHINFYKKKLFISRKRLFLLIYLLNFNYTLLDMCFKVLSGLPGTPTDLKNLIDRSTICGPYGPSGPSGGESNHMVSLVGKARHDGIKKKNERTEFVTNLITHSFIYIITFYSNLLYGHCILLTWY